MWQQEAPDQVSGSATLYDITGDGVKDVFIGGRSPHLKALDGKTGKVLWEYQYQFENDSVLQYAHFGFYNVVLVPPTRTRMAYPDLLTINGGNAKAAPNSEADRFPGVLMVMDSKTGHILAADTMPDGKESYMSPLCFFQQPGTQDFTLVLEPAEKPSMAICTRPKLSVVLEKKLSRAKVIASERGHGFIAPPVLADISGDGYFDIVAISHGSTVFAIDGKDQKLLWQRNIPATESLAIVLPWAYFTDDEVPDFFTFVSKGAWPSNTGTLQLLIDGKDGHVAYQNSLGCSGFSSPVAYDLNGDGRDEVILSINEYDCTRNITDQSSFPVKTNCWRLTSERSRSMLLIGPKVLKIYFPPPGLATSIRMGTWILFIASISIIPICLPFWE